MAHVREVDCDGLLFKILNFLNSDLLEQCFFAFLVPPLVLMLFYTFCSFVTALLGIDVFQGKGGLETVNLSFVVIAFSFLVPLIDDVAEGDPEL